MSAPNQILSIIIPKSFDAQWSVEKILLRSFVVISNVTTFSFPNQGYSLVIERWLQLSIVSILEF